jgi:uncharacterized membrane protein
VSALVALFAVAVAGMALNWPQGRRLHPPPGTKNPATLEATVVATRLSRCPTPGERGCVRATVRVDGATSTLDTIDPAISGRVAAGDAILVYRTGLPAGAVDANGLPVGQYAFADFQRRRPLAILAVAFAAVALLTGRMRGLRALLGLAVSFGVAVRFIVPAIAEGRSPIAVAGFGGLAMVLATIPLVHGGGAKSVAACLGTAAALAVTLALADVMTHVAHLNGATSDEALYVQAAGSVSLRGLLVAGMAIGALGVLGDTTVTQASVVIELRRANAALGFRQLTARATTVGRDHIAATVNTLVLAYLGAAIPVLLIFDIGGTSLGSALNQEAVADALVAMLVGSIGLMLAVPLTTALAAWLALQAPAERLAPAHAH